MHRLLQPAPADDHVAKGVQVQGRVGQRLVDLALHHVAEQRLGHLAEMGVEFFQRLTQIVQRVILTGLAAGVLNQCRELLERRALVHRHLAAQQIQRLDTMCAFVDRIQTVVTVVLLDRILPGIASATEDLNGVFVGLEAELRGPGLDDRREQIQQLQGRLALFLGFQGLGIVEQPCSVQAQVEGAFHIGFLGQQQTLDVGVLDDRDLRGSRILAIGQTALGPVAGIFQGIQVTGVAEHDRAHADADPRLVHHLEHVRQTVVRLADQVTDALAFFAEVQRGGGGAAPAHLVEQTGQGHVVALADSAVIVDQELGHDKQGNTFHAGRCIRQLGQDHVHDVFRQRMITAGDIDLVALQAIAAVFCGFCLGADV